MAALIVDAAEIGARFLLPLLESSPELAKLEGSNARLGILVSQLRPLLSGGISIYTAVSNLFNNYTGSRLPPHFSIPEMEAARSEAGSASIRIFNRILDRQVADLIAQYPEYRGREEDVRNAIISVQGHLEQAHDRLIDQDIASNPYAQPQSSIGTRQRFGRRPVDELPEESRPFFRHRYGRRPQSEDVSIDIKEQEEGPVMDVMPRPHRNITRPSYQKGIGIATGIGVTTYVGGTATGSPTPPAPPTPTTPAPTPTTPAPTPTPPITTPPFTISIPEDTKIQPDIPNEYIDLSNEDEPKLFNLGIKGAYKYPRNKWTNAISQNYAYQAFFNSLTGNSNFL